MEKLRLGLIGLGTVGSGVYKSAAQFENIEIICINDGSSDGSLNILQKYLEFLNFSKSKKYKQRIFVLCFCI